MKRIFLLLAIISLLSSCSKNSNKSIEHIDFDFANNERPRDLERLEYDDDGYLIKRIWYSNVKLEWKVVYSYNSDGIRTGRVKYNSLGDVLESQKYDINNKSNKAEAEVKTKIEPKSVKETDSEGNIILEAEYDEYGDLTTKATYEYDIDGHCVKAEYYDKYNIYYTIKYNPEGYIIEELNYNHRGNLLSKIIYNYYPDENRTEWVGYDSYGKLIERYLFTYNLSGSILECKGYRSDGELEYKTKSVNDANGNRIDYELMCYYEEPNSEKWLFKYDSDRNIIEEANYSFCENEWSINNTYKYKYDANGNRIEVSTYNPEGIMLGKTTTKYDSFRNIIEKIVYGSDGKIDNKYITKYNSEGNKKETAKSFIRDGNKYTETTRKFNSKGKIIESVSYKGGKLIKKFIATCNSEDEIIETSESEYNNGKLVKENICKYNSAGIKTESASYGLEGVLYNKYVSKWNSQGNMTEECEYGNGEYKGEERYKYDSDGNLIECEYYNSDGYLKLISKYNPQGECTEAKKYDSNGKLQEIVVYEYAFIGNEIEKCVYDSIGTLQYKTKIKTSNGGQREIMKEIANGLDGKVGFLYSLFVGENSLNGEYNKKELYAIKYALSDKVLEKGELPKNVMNELRESKDLDKIINYGFTVK
ncbi:MAG: hypothetical protein IKU59_01670 [Bacteroidales bacterium]|nr:hypothetical protein [Bacteroidales bacterium]